MRRQRSIFDIFPENVDLNQGPNFNSSGMNDLDECNSRFSPTERSLLSNDLSDELNFSFVNAGHHHSSQSFSSWDVGEPSSRASLQDQVANDGLKLDSNWSNGSQVAVGPSNMHKHMAMDVDLNVDYRANSGNPDMEASSSGTSDECGADFSFGHWGPSSKRKVLEGTSGEIFGSGSSSCFPEAENIAWHTPNCYNGSSSLSASSPLANSHTSINTIAGVVFPPPSVSGVAESSRRNYGTRDSGPNALSTGNPGSYPSSSSSHQSVRRSSHGEYLDQTSRGPIATSSGSIPVSLQLPLVHIQGMPRNTHPFPWSGSSLPRESGSEANFRSSLGNNEQNRPSNETRTSVQDPNNWSLGMGRASTNGSNPSSSSRNEMGSGSHPSNSPWTPRLNPTTQSQQRLSDFSPWTLFPSSEADSVGHRGHFPPFSSGPSLPSEENVLSSRTNSHGRTHQPFLRPAPSMEAHGDEWQSFAADIDGRHRLVAEVCALTI